MQLNPYVLSIQLIFSSFSSSFRWLFQMTKRKSLQLKLFTPYYSMIFQACSKQFGRKDHLKKHVKTHDRSFTPAAAVSAISPFPGFPANIFPRFSGLCGPPHLMIPRRNLWKNPFMWTWWKTKTLQVLFNKTSGQKLTVPIKPPCRPE